MILFLNLAKGVGIRYKLLLQITPSLLRVYHKHTLGFPSGGHTQVQDNNYLGSVIKELITLAHRGTGRRGTEEFFIVPPKTKRYCWNRMLNYGGITYNNKEFSY